MKNRSIKIALCVIFSLFSINAASAQQTKIAQIDSLMRRANRLGLFNGNILVTDHDKVIYQAALGFTDASGKTVLTTEYRFHIGSIAKEFNAVSIMLLQQQGKLNIEDKVSKYLPQLPKWAATISIKNLLQYTSGLPDVKWATVKSDAQNMADLQKLDHLDFEPGSNYAYNNNNVFLQRRIIERVSGLTFKQFVEQNLLKPCGMNTAIVDPVDNDPLMAKAYNSEHKQDALLYPISGWTCVTLADFYKWSQAIATFKLINPASTRAILIPVAPGRQSGLGGGSMDGNKVVSHVHDGTSLNYQALLAASIPQGRTVILMTNNKNVSLYDFNTAIQAIIDGKPYHEPKRSLMNAYQKQIDTLSGAKTIDLYNTLKNTKSNEFAFDDESTLNSIGYGFLNKKRYDDAIVIFEYNTKLFPASGNVFDSLGEAYYKQGNKTKALLNYKHSLELDPANQNARDVIKELEK